MGSWGFIGLAYGLAAVVLLGYLVGLRRRLAAALAELTALEQRDPRRSP